jgi:hypothetical protein
LASFDLTSELVAHLVCVGLDPVDCAAPEGEQLASHTVAGEIDPVRVVNDAIEEGVGVDGIVDQLVPFVDGDLAGEDRRSAAAAFFQNLEQVVTRGGVERLEAPVLEDQQLHASERARDAGIAPVAAGEREVGEQLGMRW